MGPWLAIALTTTALAGDGEVWLGGSFLPAAAAPDGRDDQPEVTGGPLTYLGLVHVAFRQRAGVFSVRADVEQKLFWTDGERRLTAAAAGQGVDNGVAVDEPVAGIDTLVLETAADLTAGVRFDMDGYWLDTTIGPWFSRTAFDPATTSRIAEWDERWQADVATPVDWRVGAILWFEAGWIAGNVRVLGRLGVGVHGIVAREGGSDVGIDTTGTQRRVDELLGVKTGRTSDLTLRMRPTAVLEVPAESVVAFRGELGFDLQYVPGSSGGQTVSSGPFSSSRTRGETTWAVPWLTLGVVARWE